MATPATPEPDDKDWTWVLDRPCPECGFDAAELIPDEFADRLQLAARAWQQVLRRPDVRTRPGPTVWSPLEYASHVRDVYALFAQRARLMLEQDDPQFSNWDQDATALEKHYWEGDVAEVGAELMGAAAGAVGVFATVEPDQWARTGRRSNGSVFTVDTLGRYFLHDVVHHLHDVG